MGERTVIADPVNLGLIVALMVLSIATGLLWFGPGQSAVQEARASFDERNERLDEWNGAQDIEREVSETERREWNARYAHLATLGVTAEADPEMIAHVAGIIGRAGVQGLEVARIDTDDPATNYRVEVEAPFGEGEGFRLIAVPMRIRFETAYGDLLRIFAAIGRTSSALSLRRVDLIRRYPKIRVEIEVDLWQREAVVS